MSTEEIKTLSNRINNFRKTKQRAKDGTLRKKRVRPDIKSKPLITPKQPPKPLPPK